MGRHTLHDHGGAMCAITWAVLHDMLQTWLGISQSDLREKIFALLGQKDEYEKPGSMALCDMELLSEEELQRWVIEYETEVAIVHL